MSGRGVWVVVPPLAGSFLATLELERPENHWTSTSFDDSVNVVSFGFMATAILISMFLLMAIFEKFIRARSAAQQPATQPVMNIESGQRGKLGGFPSPLATTVYAREVSVVMPGEEVPTFIVHPTPQPCPAESVSWPLHCHHSPHPAGSLSTLLLKDHEPRTPSRSRKQDQQIPSYPMGLYMINE